MTRHVPSRPASIAVAAAAAPKRVARFNPDRPVALADAFDGSPTHLRVYATKRVGADVEAYDRAYGFLGVLTAAGYDHLRRTATVVDSWNGWTGGVTSDRGAAEWWKLGA